MIGRCLDSGFPCIRQSATRSLFNAEMGIGAGHVSLTDDAGLVIAFAVVETS